MFTKAKTLITISKVLDHILDTLTSIEDKIDTELIILRREVSRGEQANQKLTAFLLRLTTNYDTDLDNNEDGADTLARSVAGGGRIEFERHMEQKIRKIERDRARGQD